MLQHIPFDSIAPPPSSVMLPPETAEVRVIPVTLSVVKTGNVTLLLVQELIPNTEHIKSTFIAFKILSDVNPFVFIMFITVRNKHMGFHLVQYSCC